MNFSAEETNKSQLIRWFILLLSPVAWTLAFGLIYLMDEAVCGLHMWRGFVWGQVTAGTLMMFFVALITLGVTLVDAYWGWKMWKNAQNSPTEEAERDRFIGLSSLMLGCLFAFLTLALITAVLVLDPC